MNSSTSPSEAAVFPRKQAAIFAAGSLLLLLACGVAVRMFVASHRPKLGVLEIMRQAKEHLPETLAATEKPILVIGASHVRHGVVPDVFDPAYEKARGQKVQSISLGFNGFGGPCMVEFVAWVAELLEEHGNSDVAVLEFNLLAATKKWRSMGAYGAYIEACQSIGAPSRFFREQMLQDPTRAAQLLARRWFMAGSNPRELTNEVRRELFDIPTWWPDQPKAPAPAGPAWSKVLASAASAWTPQARGGRLDMTTASPALTEARKLAWTVAAHKFTAARRDKMAGIRELEFDPSSVADQITAIRELQHVVKNVVVIVTPAESAVIGETPASKQNRAAAIEKVRHETGACVLDMYESPDFTHDDFDDVDHLNPHGAEKYSRMLAQKLAAWDAAGRSDCSTLE